MTPRNRTRIAVMGGLSLAVLAAAGGLRAFPSSASWHDDPSQGLHCGGGDIWANGSTRDWGITCQHCHVNNAGQQGHFEVALVGLTHAQQYVPGKTYTLMLAMVRPSGSSELGQGSYSNRNGMTASIEDAKGNAAGSLLGDQQSACPPDAPSVPDDDLPGQTYAYGDCHAVASLGKTGLLPAPASWSFKWTAPAAGSGPLTLYYGVVDGDGDRRSLGDDVKVGKVTLVEQ